MTISFSPTICPRAFLPDALSIAKSAGYSQVELYRDRTESTPVHSDLSVRMVRDHLASEEIRISALNIRNLTGRKADSDERNLPYNLRQLEWDIHLGRAIGTHSMNVRGGARTEEALEDLIEGVNALLDRVPDVTLNVGNGTGTRIQGREDFDQVVPELNDRAMVLLDTGSLLEAGEDVIAIAEAFAGRMGVVHLTDRTNGKTVPFGEGDLPFGELFRILSDSGFDGTLVVELDPCDAGDPSAAAAEALKFVEGLLLRE